jgi:hypothetical protein
MESLRRTAKKNTLPQTQSNSLNVAVLKVDKDCFVDKDWIDNYVQLIVKTCRDFDVAVDVVKICASKKKGLHFYIYVRSAVDAELANMLQWLLGDDCRRVDFNRARIESGLHEWNKLFEVARRRLKTIYRKEEK